MFSIAGSISLIAAAKAGSIPGPPGPGGGGGGGPSDLGGGAPPGGIITIIAPLQPANIQPFSFSWLWAYPCAWQPA